MKYLWSDYRLECLVLRLSRFCVTQNVGDFLFAFLCSCFIACLLAFFFNVNVLLLLLEVDLKGSLLIN